MKDRKAKMIDMREKGFTYQEIGKAFNLSRQRVCQLIGGQVKSHFREITPNDCVYPILRKWMNDNRITRAELCRKLYGNTHACNSSKCRAFLRGVNREAKKRTIDKYLLVTGLTYEELFATEGGVINGQPAADVVPKIFAEFEKIINRYCKDYKYSIADVLLDIAELKKKYKEEHDAT